MAMILAVDIGNSLVKAGLLGDGEEVVAGMSVDTHPAKSPKEYEGVFGGLLGGRPVEGAVLCSVVPGRTGAVGLAIKGVTGSEPLVVGPDVTGGLTLDVSNPLEVGPDRIASAAAAAWLYGAPSATVTLGTATTVNFIGEGNVFIGGAILPGIGTMLKSLSLETARLPEVGLGTPSGVVGKTTEECILSGVLYGTVHAVEGILKRAEDELGSEFRVVVTGGFAENVLPLFARGVTSEPDLVLKGLKIIYGRYLYA